ncbi:MAG: alpha-2-macroglobulin, partial [bacterium]
VDWRVRVVKEGRAVVRMKALTDEESDAMEMKFPVYVHGMLKTESWSGVLRPDRDRQEFSISVPAERRPEQSRLEIRYSPTLAGALVDALPYMVDYPYGCTEQTLNRFLPTVLVQKTLKDMGLDLKAIRDKQTNLNAQEIGDDKERAAQWKRNNPPNPGEERNPVFDEAVVKDMVRQGLKALTAMQCDDGGWGWFSGWGERSWPHTTAYVVHGLQIAKQNGVAVVPGVLERGVEWLAKYQAEELRKLRNYSLRLTLLDCKSHADDMDAFTYMVLVDAGRDNSSMRDYLYNGRTNLSVYAKAMFGLALHKTGQVEKRDMILRNIEQYLVRDPENQTAYLNLGNSGYWWYWYGSENEAHAYYLKLLAATAPKGEVASELVKYLLNNRKHATYWNSTRDTALCIEAMADYLKASGEDKPDMTVEVFLDGKSIKKSRITAESLFSFDNKLVLEGVAVSAGKHTVEVRRQGRGPVYFNAYLTNFTLEDPITRAGLEIKVNRSFYKLIPANKTIKAAGSRGQALDQKVEKFERKRLNSGDSLKSGDLIEVELEIASKNDYEYVVFEDMKAAGFEPVEVRSGYNGNDIGAFVEFRDERVCFFVRQIPRGQNSVSYRLRAEIPGQFSALPARASAMYAPELKANSDEIKLKIED